MALTSTVRGKNVVVAGNVKRKYFDLTFTSVTGGEVKTGLSNVYFAVYVPSTTEDAGIVYLNSASASATEDDFGSVYIDGVTSDDTGYLMVEGV